MNGASKRGVVNDMESESARSSPADSRRADVVVVGGGPAGLTAALALAQAGLDVICLAPAPASGTQPPARDARTAALMQGSIRLLERLGVWSRLSGSVAPLWKMGIVDDTRRLLRAPKATFDAHELGTEPFGWNVPLVALNEALDAAGRSEPHLAILQEPARDFSIEREEARVTTAGGRRIGARLVVAADGRESPAREAAGIRVDRHRDNQAALICAFSHERPHDSTSTEYHRRAGPLTVVPLPGNRSSLVWVERPERAQALAALDSGGFAQALSEAIHSSLGRISRVSRRTVIEISGLAARTFARNRTVLVGEAAHVLPPIGAQGLNLGLRDAALIAELAGDAHYAQADIGAEGLLQAYHRRRNTDVAVRAGAVDLLNRTLLSDLLPAQAVRSAGLGLISLIGPLRRSLMRQGIGPSADLPRLMRP